MAERRSPARPGHCQVGQPASEAHRDRAGLAVAAPPTGQRPRALVPRAGGLQQGPDAPDYAGCDGPQADCLVVALRDGRDCARGRRVEGLSKFAAAAAGCSRRSGTSVDRCPPGPQCRCKDGSRSPGLALAHERGMLVRTPSRADRIQGGAARRRPESSEAGPDFVQQTAFARRR